MKFCELNKNVKVANRRKLYEFAVSNHPKTAAEIEVGKPHDLNPSIYEDTKTKLCKLPP